MIFVVWETNNGTAGRRDAAGRAHQVQNGARRLRRLRHQDDDPRRGRRADAVAGAAPRLLPLQPVDGQRRVRAHRQPALQPRHCARHGRHQRNAVSSFSLVALKVLLGFIKFYSLPIGFTKFY